MRLKVNKSKIVLSRDESEFIYVTTTNLLNKGAGDSSNHTVVKTVALQFDCNKIGSAFVVTNRPLSTGHYYKYDILLIAEEAAIGMDIAKDSMKGMSRADGGANDTDSKLLDVPIKLSSTANAIVVGLAEYDANGNKVNLTLADFEGYYIGYKY